MRRRIFLFAVLAALASPPMTASAQSGAASPIFINEIHYDNAGTDAGEAIEVVAPEGTSLAGYSLVLYNGAGGAAYDTDALSGTVGPSRTVTQTYPSNGIQNGAPDAIALIGPGNVVIQFLSYEGTFTATGGPAAGSTSTDIGVSENGLQTAGMSLQLSGSGDSYGDFAWQSARTSSFGALNADQTYTATGGPGGGDPPPPGPCGGAIDPISEVQGPGDATPCAGQVVTVEGIVTGDFQGAGSLSGVFIQDPAPDADAATSEGIFVFAPSGPALAEGDRVRITGTAVEFRGLTEITNVTATEVLEAGVALPAATIFDLPADTVARERLEGMRIVVPETLSVTESRNADNFGELRLSSGGVLSTPTEVAEPGPAAAAVAAENMRRNIILDDAESPANPRPVPYFSPLDSLRRGDTTSGLTGILSYGFDQYRVQPTIEPTFAENNPRPAAPESVGGDIQIGSFNVLNYFITFGRSEDRGADDEAEFAQQQAKIVDAINGLGAEVVALQEIQDTSDEAAFGNDPDAALDRLVAALNADPDSNLVWAKVPAPAPYTNTDEIRNAIIYQPSKVARVGAPGALNEPAFANARTPLSQTFRAGSETLTVVANHFKSKSGTGSGDNANTGQGSFNGDRVRQARALLAYIRELQGSTGDPDVLALGDLNSYTREDPIDVLVEGGLRDVASTRISEADRYSFVFDGAQGNLDHEIATPELDAKITGADIWHINADEPDAFQYTGPEEFFAPDAYAASDHDPSLVGLETGESGGAPLIAGAGDTADGTIFDFTITGSKQQPAGRAAFVAGSRTVAGDVTCLRLSGERAVFGIADTESGSTVYREYYVEDDPRGDRLIELGIQAGAPKKHCSSHLPREGSGVVLARGAITFASRAK
ncbi:MAG: ExeM/NucH family extracellular endonuclease [Actinomycetota bacterium]|nr:ExeM/NucH family extracellular endonuclease [Actinomycetota bacterium]